MCLVAVVSGQAAAASDALTQRAVADLTSFTTWLAKGKARGFIGEVGWPGNPAAGGDSRWNGVAQGWYGEAAKSGLSVAAWATGEFWSPSYKLLVYTTGETASASPNPQAAIVERQTASDLRGVNVAGPEFATPVDESTSSFSNARRGVPGVDYVYPSQAVLDALAARGVSFIRLPVRWERVQPIPGGELDSSEVARLVSCLARAAAADLGVVLDLHNYGAYYLLDPARGVGVRRAIGSAELPAGAFADLWRRLSTVLRDEPAIIAYGLMNEPVGLKNATVWESASRAAVRAIRANGDENRVLVQAYDWGGVLSFKREHPGGPWIDDRSVWYEAHQYFDSDGSARYVASYDQELARARRSLR
jgi:Cellulase (glycosyl hydrolase family 5)